MVPAIGPAAWEALLELGRCASRGCSVGLGIHPQLLPELPEADDERHLARLDELLGARRAIAVGECGLDGPSAAGAPMERQVRVLRAHFALARKHELPCSCTASGRTRSSRRSFARRRRCPRGAC